MSEMEKGDYPWFVGLCFMLRGKWCSRTEQRFSAIEEDLNASPLAPPSFLWGSHSQVYLFLGCQVPRICDSLVLEKHLEGR